MFTAVCWIKKGYAKEDPKKFSVVGTGNDIDLDDIPEGEGLMEHSSDSEEDIKADIPMDEISKKYGLDTYDEEEDIPSFIGSELQILHGNKDIYNITEEIDEDEEEDLKIKKTDSLILAAVAEDNEFSHVSTYIYEEQEKNLYVHHDIILPAFPLALEWIGHNPNPNPDQFLRHGSNFAAIGTFYPEIEIWDLDVIDVMEPVCSLGGPEKSIFQSSNNNNNNSKSSKKKRLQDKLQQMQSEKIKEGSHQDAVMGLSWNSILKNVLASGSADKTAKIWDLYTQKCVYTFVHHTDKVQSVAWHTTEANLLLTASYDKSAVVVDARSPNQPHRWTVSSDVETAQWNPHCPQQFFVTTEDGFVTCFDSLVPGRPLFSFQAHKSAVSGFSVSPFIPNCVATASTDKSLKIWNLSNNTPSVAFEKHDMHAEIFALNWHKDLPFLLAIGGKEHFEVVNTKELESFARSFADQISKF